VRERDRRREGEVLVRASPRSRGRNDNVEGERDERVRRWCGGRGRE
jgi:hypothetical protein